MAKTFRHVFGFLFYQHPVWIVLHNFLHAPLVILSLWGIAAVGAKRKVRGAHWFCWFFAACLLHSTVDVLTHNDDGPLLFFPLDWGYRFSSPVSYWDPDHYGRPFAIFEVLLDLGLAGFLLSRRAAPEAWGK
jgi:membrane-bound metal-dependent hydrolase YbcI (DUF457 family)